MMETPRARPLVHNQPKPSPYDAIDQQLRGQLPYISHECGMLVQREAWIAINALLDMRNELRRSLEQEVDSAGI